MIKVVKMIRQWIKKKLGLWWTPVYCRQPYPEGWGIHREKGNITLDVALSYEKAKNICDETNFN